ncbi:putative nuclease HARBI1 [Haliotis cracherodii]|uniref:putative nuclease HARBI1 n=1 Tax=Haliotis cracherodii TaxID=6455 RepID=UPI0039E9952D
MKNVIEEAIDDQDDEPMNLLTCDDYFEDIEQAEDAGLLATFAHFPEEEHARVRNYIESTVNRYSLDDFHMHFRMLRTEILMGEIASSMSRCVSQSLEGKVLSSLWFLSNRESYREVADKFGIDRGHQHRIVMEFCKSVSNLSARYLAWPSEAQAERIMTAFENKTGFPQVLGCIDGTHIDIKGQEDRGSYINRKGQSSIQVQAVCDNKMRFVDVSAGYPGSVHDARVFKESPLFEMLERKSIVKEGHLLGDAAYPLKTYLLTPYRDNGHLNPSKKRFNFVHSSCRCVIERAFALLKGKFRKLIYLDMNLITSIPDFVLTTCVLHNLILVHESQDQESEYFGVYVGVAQSGIEPMTFLSRSLSTRL